MRFATLLFDLDGTLVDSVPDLTTAVNRLRTGLNLAPLSRRTVAGYVGDGATMLVKRALPDGDFTPALLERFLDFYGEHLLDQTEVFPGIREFLQGHRDRKMAVVTNKPHRFSLELLRGLGLLDYFGAVVGGDSCGTKKPDPAPVRFALQQLNASPESCLMIGDHHTDLLAGRAAGVQTCFCAWGCGRRDGVPSDFEAASPQDLLRLFPGEER